MLENKIINFFFEHLSTNKKLFSIVKNKDSDS